MSKKKKNWGGREEEQEGERCKTRFTAHGWRTEQKKGDEEELRKEEKADSKTIFKWVGAQEEEEKKTRRREGDELVGN